MQPLLVFIVTAFLVLFAAAAGTGIIPSHAGHRPAHGTIGGKDSRRLIRDVFDRRFPKRDQKSLCQLSTHLKPLLTRGVDATQAHHEIGQVVVRDDRCHGEDVGPPLGPVGPVGPVTVEAAPVGPVTPVAQGTPPAATEIVPVPSGNAQNPTDEFLPE